ncbi:MAG: hypothetical protein RL215_111, partial [Planctomycetota bacterium]
LTRGRETAADRSSLSLLFKEEPR